ncbi:MAG TPA: sulfatase-like hydrolase/transferase [Acidobacteriota bacterium]
MILPAVHGAILLGALLAQPASDPRPAPPNLLLITIDTLRADALGCYGGAPDSTPRLDRLAAEGVRFANAYAHVPLTLPSHTSILTGRYPFEHGIRDNGGYRFAGRQPTLASLLKARGYRTGAFVSAFPLDRRFGLDAGFDHYDDCYGERSSWRRASIVERPAAATWEPARAWLAQQPDGPWLLWLHFFDPHFPYDPPAGAPREIAGQAYLAEVHYVDSIVGEVLDSIRQASTARPTLIAVTSDHGESLGEHGELTHGIFAYDATLRVPWLLAGAGVPRGRVVDGVARHIDMLPTLLELLGVEPPAEIAGRSLAPALRAAQPSGIQESYFEAMSAHFGRGWPPLRGVIRWPLKFIDLPIAELYDLTADPGETDNLAEHQPVQSAASRARLQQLDSALVEPPDQALSSEERRKLEALGYVRAPSGARTGRVYTAADDPKRLIQFERDLDRAVALYLAGSQTEALSRLQELIQRRPELKEAYLQLATFYSKRGEPKRAAEVLRGALERGVQDAELMAHAGLYRHEAGDVAGARSLLQAALRADPDYADAHNFLGVVLAAQGDPAGAQREFEAVLALDPGNGEALLNLGSLRLSQGQPRPALALFERALQQDPNLANAHNGSGVAWIQLGERDRALEAWRRAVRLDPELWDALFNVGKLLLDSPDPRSALPFLRQFVSGAPRARYRKDIDFFNIKINELENGEHSWIQGSVPIQELG